MQDHKIGKTALIGLALAVLPAAALSGAALAQDGKSADGIKLAPVSVSAPRYQELPQERLTTAISQVSGDEIKAQQITKLNDVLRLLPGVTLGGQQSSGGSEPAMIRGLGFRNTRVFVDGVEISDTSQTQSQYGFGDMYLGDVERVEVLRGPQPGRFGPDTAGGVINVVTRRPTGPFAAFSNLEYGSYNTRRGDVGVEGALDKIDYRLVLAGVHSGSYSDFTKDLGGLEKDPFRRWSVHGRLGVQATDDLRFDATLRYQRKWNSYDDDFGDASWSRAETERSVRVGATLNTLDGKLVHVLGIGNSMIYREFYGDGTAGDSYDGRKTRIDYTGNATLSPVFNIRYGVDAVREYMTQEKPGFAPSTPHLSADNWRNGGFVTLGITPLERFDLTATLRGDRHTDFGGKGTWRLGAAYSLEATNTTLRTSYGTSWQTPSLFERYDQCSGNANLKAENGRGWDVGLEQSVLDSKLTGSVTYFQARSRDQIAWGYSAPTSPGCWGGSYYNVDETSAKGVEVELTARPVAQVELRVGYTWQHVEDARTGLRLRNRPMNQGTANVNWQLSPELNANIGMRYQGAVSGYLGTAGDFVTTDIRLAYAISEAISVHGRIENLFDRRYEEVRNHYRPGRSAYVGVSTRF